MGRTCAGFRNTAGSGAQSRDDSRRDSQQNHHRGKPMSLAEFQEAFSQALFSSEVTTETTAYIPHLSPSPLQTLQFGAYRKRALLGLADVLRDVYPTAEAVMGPEEFLAASDAYFLQHPPRAVDPILITEGFGPFLDQLAADKKPPHLPDVATLDFGCFKARQAIEASSM